MDLRLPDGRRGRFVQLVVSPRVDEEDDGVEHTDDLDENDFLIPDSLQSDSAIVIVVFARSREAMDDLLLKVYATLAGMDLLFLSLVEGLVRRVLRKGFQPVEEMNAQIGELGPNRLHKQLVLSDTPVELESVVSAVNRLLEKLHDDFQRERRFTSDVAHELRTPVAEFRAACEVGAKWSDDADLVQRRFKNLQQSAFNMERLLNGLLDLSRLDSGSVQVQAERIEVASLLESCWVRVSAKEPEIGIRLENRIAPDLAIQTDRVKLDMIVSNLLSNAACYSVAGSLVICTSATLADGRRELRICNHARDLEQEDMQHILERFWRKDAARTGGRHAGLGLSIVKLLADILGIQMTAELSTDKVFTVVLLFPFRETR